MTSDALTVLTVAQPITGTPLRQPVNTPPRGDPPIRNGNVIDFGGVTVHLPPGFDTLPPTVQEHLAAGFAADRQARLTRNQAILGLVANAREGTASHDIQHEANRLAGVANDRAIQHADHLAMMLEDDSIMLPDDQESLAVHPGADCH